MARFYKVTETTIISGQSADAIWHFDDLKSAKSRFHSIMASAYANPDVEYALSVIVDDRGYVVERDRIPELTDEE